MTIHNNNVKVFLQLFKSKNILIPGNYFLFQIPTEIFEIILRYTGNIKILNCHNYAES